MDEFNFDTLQVAQDLLITREECDQRGLSYSAKWYVMKMLLPYLHRLIIPNFILFTIYPRLAELNFALSKKVDGDVLDSLVYEPPVRTGKEKACYYLAKKYFDVKEYSRYNI